MLRRHCEKNNNTINMFCLPLIQMRDRDTDIVRRMESTKPPRVVVIRSVQHRKKHVNVCFEVRDVENKDQTWPWIDLKDGLSCSR